MAAIAKVSAVTTKAAILQALVRSEAYGLELIERVKEKTGGRVVLGQGTLYPALRELERDGFVKSRESEPLPERGGRPRVYYKLTGLGAQQALEDREAAFGLFELAPVKGV